MAYWHFFSDKRNTGMLFGKITILLGPLANLLQLDTWAQNITQMRLWPGLRRRPRYCSF